MCRCKLPAYNWRWRRHNTVPLSLIRSTVAASVCRPKGGGAEPARPALNPPLAMESLTFDFISSSTEC